MVREYDRAGRKKQITALLKSEKRLLSSYELAKKMQVSPSWYWRNLFTEMWQEGLIVACYVMLRNGKKAYFWGDASLDCYTQVKLQGLE